MAQQWAVMREVAGLNPGSINIQDLTVTEEKVLPLKLHPQKTFKSSRIRTINRRPRLTK